jgi:tetratricopeptide (TPR) repeat protein
MKLVVSILFIIGVSVAVYYFAVRMLKSNKKYSGINKKALGVSTAVTVALLVLQFWVIYQGAHDPDSQCTTVHTVAYNPIKQLNSAADYFVQGDNDYDTGFCDKAIENYSAAIQIKPDYPQAYNNRAYTYMRLRQYAKALPDLNKAIELKPDYIQALMNRGDLYNYYGPIIDRKRAVADYEHVISLGGGKETSVCGHLFLAKHNGWNIGTILDLPRAILASCN